ncbi:Myosin-IIIb [Pseudocyphellaria aurata]|nr:Myosin-IIIb [Pseudocyphellaria aurata]
MACINSETLNPSFASSHASETTRSKKQALFQPSESSDMKFTTTDIGLPEWEIIHVYQDEKADAKYGSTILLLRRIAFTEESFAVCKIITPPDGNDQKLNEANVLTVIPPHPNIIKLYSSHTDVPSPGKVSLVLEYCAGGDFLALSRHASRVGKRIPEVFVWHALYQTLVALEHMDRYHISHHDLHLGNLFLRPVGENGYPDVVLADFEYADYQLEPNRRVDYSRLGTSMKFYILETADDGTGPYSQEVREFIEALECSFRTVLLIPEQEREMIPFSKKMAYGDNGTSHEMPMWMMNYFAEVKSKAAPRQNNLE